jgi:NADPH:quinone reductase-like Zn-dependent oxidoreductase
LSGAPVWGTGGGLGIARDGTHAEYIVLPQEAVARRPEKLTAEQAAAAGVPFITAYSALVRLGEVKPGEWVIVAGAAGAVGQAAIQIAHAKHAHTIALVRNTKDSWISKSPGVGAVAYSERNDLPTVVRALTAGKGAGLALNGVGASVFSAIMQSLKIGGRQIIYSAAGGRDFTLDLQFVYRNDLSIVGLGTEKLTATQCAAILNELAPMFDSGTLKPPKVDERYPLAKAPEAYARVAAGGNGKVVLLMQ